MFELYLPPDRIKGKFTKGAAPYNKGVKWSENKNLSEAGKQKSLQGLKRSGNPKLAGWNAKPVLMFKEEKIIGYFKNSNEAGIKTGIQSRNIRHVCEGKRKTAGGYKWKFEKDLK